MKDWLQCTSNTNDTTYVGSNTFEANNLIRSYEIETVSKFSIQVSTKDFGETDMYSKKHKIRWEEESLEFDGIPFVVVNAKRLDCHHGKDRRFHSKQANIKDGLQVVKEWNPEFKPMYAMVDYCREEIDAIESLFPGKFTQLVAVYTIKKTNCC